MQCEATAYTIAANPRSEEGEGEKEKQPKSSSDFPKRCAEVLQAQVELACRLSSVGAAGVVHARA